jgi:hypothetical protein
MRGDPTRPKGSARRDILGWQAGARTLRQDWAYEVTDLRVYRLSDDLFGITFLTAGEADHSMKLNRENLQRLLHQGTHALAPRKVRPPRD